MGNGVRGEVAATVRGEGRSLGGGTRGINRSRQEMIEKPTKKTVRELMAEEPKGRGRRTGGVAHVPQVKEGRWKADSNNGKSTAECYVCLSPPSLGRTGVCCQLRRCSRGRG